MKFRQYLKNYLKKANNSKPIDSLKSLEFQQADPQYCIEAVKAALAEVKEIKPINTDNFATSLGIKKETKNEDADDFALIHFLSTKLKNQPLSNTRLGMKILKYTHKEKKPGVLQFFKFDLALTNNQENQEKKEVTKNHNPFMSALRKYKNEIESSDAENEEKILKIVNNVGKKHKYSDDDTLRKELKKALDAEKIVLKGTSLARVIREQAYQNETEKEDLAFFQVEDFPKADAKTQSPKEKYYDFYFKKLLQEYQNDKQDEGKFENRVKNVLQSSVGCCEAFKAVFTVSLEGTELGARIKKFLYKHGLEANLSEYKLQNALSSEGISELKLEREQLVAAQKVDGETRKALSKQLKQQETEGSTLLQRQREKHKTYGVTAIPTPLRAELIKYCDEDNGASCFTWCYRETREHVAVVRAVLAPETTINGDKLKSDAQLYDALKRQLSGIKIDPHGSLAYTLNLYATDHKHNFAVDFTTTTPRYTEVDLEESSCCTPFFGQ